MFAENLTDKLISATEAPPIQRTHVDFSTLGRAPSAATIGHWFNSLASLQRKVAGSTDFFADAAHAVCEPGGLDAGFILQRDHVKWRTVAEYHRSPDFREAVDYDLLMEVEQSRSSCQVHGSVSTGRESLRAAAIAVPILQQDGSLWGIVYGIRAVRNDNRRRQIRPLEALWLQLVAESLGSGVARLEAEERSLKTRILFEQAFAPQLVQELQRNPRLLTAREQIVTVLFCDLREFSRVTAIVPPRTTYDLLSELMDLLTACVMDQEGVIVDYYGDGLSAIWNAPLPQPDHAEKACGAAWEMQRQLPSLSRRWHNQIQRPLRIGCGIHTGSALVGNSGSQRRPKYRPRGVTVNIASRLESATKVIQSPIVLSQATRNALPASFLTHRIATCRVPGIENPVDLHGLCSVGKEFATDAMVLWIRQYEEALCAFEAGSFAAANSALQGLPQVRSADHVSSQFLLRCVAAQIDNCPSRRKSDRNMQMFDPVVTLDGP
ncbi:MAG: adenylate/guanylate cyclase domain-containing protein [Planctomycetota bacterium]|nr:adenylate/guanylate cyclase domain-containing protein [Planctomycetota bacterium]